MFRAPLQGLSESKKFRTWTKCENRRRATCFAQTISPSALTSMSGTSRFTKTLPKSPCPHPPAPQKGSRNGACFLLYRLGKSSNNQLNEKQGAAGRIFEADPHQTTPLLRLSACLVNNTSVRKCAGSGADGWSTLSGEGDSREI